MGQRSWGWCARLSALAGVLVSAFARGDAGPPMARTGSQRPWSGCDLPSLRCDAAPSPGSKAWESGAAPSTWQIARIAGALELCTQSRNQVAEAHPSKGPGRGPVGGLPEETQRVLYQGAVSVPQEWYATGPRYCGSHGRAGPCLRSNPTVSPQGEERLRTRRRATPTQRHAGTA